MVWLFVLWQKIPLRLSKSLAFLGDVYFLVEGGHEHPRTEKDVFFSKSIGEGCLLQFGPKESMRGACNGQPANHPISHQHASV